uniref:Uncharacterized protein n=1 Tax=Paramoeba aestuarina TaxID=180227 RepID=A0A7S4NKC0_9EUKA|mmetsp:Transcript_18561/g.29084  ORF Transcript_18561/g.29084 Transcript_18561/m.29084 type:complete len:537 (+) Transcript_18561:20-1630(+)
MNPLESLFNRLEISEHFEKFQSRGISNIHHLRSMDPSEIIGITDSKVGEKLINALSNGSVRVPGTIQADQVHRSENGHPRQRGKGRTTKSTQREKSSSKESAGNTSSDVWMTMGKKQPKAKKSAPMLKVMNGMVTEGFLEKTKTISPRGRAGRLPEKPAADVPEAVADSKKNTESTKPERCKNTDAQLSLSLTDKQISFLFAEKGVRLREIHENFGTSNQRIYFNKNEPRDTVSFQIYGSSLEKCQSTKEAIEKLVGITRQKEEDARFHYHMNEANMNTQAMLYIMRKEDQLGDDSLRSIASYLNFEKRQEAEHFIYFCKNDKVKKGMLDMLIDQFGGVIQMIIYCTGKQAPLLHEHLVKSKTLNQVKPILLIPATKEDRKEFDADALKQRREDALKDFKAGIPSSRINHSEDGKETVLQRLLIATDDYARYARTREIPYVNLIIHYSPPKQREWSLFRSETLARGGKAKAIVGYELTLFSESESSIIEELKDFVAFKKIPHEEEQAYFHRWSQTLTPETQENLYVDYAKVEPMEN